MRKYQHVYFDLDRTLWDFDTNVGETLIEILAKFKIFEEVPDASVWVDSYRRINKQVWQQFEERKINKTTLRQERFRLLLKEFGVVNEALVVEISQYFIANSPFKKALMPNAKEVLAYLSGKYKLYIISNGFYATQQRKLESSGIKTYFTKVFTSDKYMVAKPAREIFEIALKSVNARKEKSIMIGDSFDKDILGARSFGMDQIWYNHDGRDGDEIGATYKVLALSEIKKIL